MSLQYLDMKDQIYPTIGIDQYQSSVGKDRDVITVDISVKQDEVAIDLVTWIERGYDWVIDADKSPGEVSDGRYLVFVELNRRTNAPERIIEMLEDLKTLTGMNIDQWRVKINDKIGPATVKYIRSKIVTNPNEYEDKQDSLNEMREIANLAVTATHDYDADVVEWQRRAGIL